MSYKDEEEKKEEGGDMDDAGFGKEDDFNGDLTDDFDPLLEDDLDMGDGDDEKGFGGFGDDSEEGY